MGSIQYATGLRTDVDASFQWFAETLSSLAGASEEFNEEIVSNGGVGALVALCGAESIDLRRHASRALGSISWNGHVDFRVVSRRARDSWATWMGIVAAENEWKWDSLSEVQMGLPMVGFGVEIGGATGARGGEAKTAKGGAKDQSELKIDLQGGEIEQVEVTTKGKGEARKRLLLLKNDLVAHGYTVRRRRLRDEDDNFGSDQATAAFKSEIEIVSEKQVLEEVGPNVQNTLSIAAAHDALKVLIALCSEEDDHIQRNASDALAVIALQDDNRGLMSRVPQMGRTLTDLCYAEDPEVQRNAAAAIANTAYRCKQNQDAFLSSGTVDGKYAFSLERSLFAYLSDTMNVWIYSLNITAHARTKSTGQAMQRER